MLRIIIIIFGVNVAFGQSDEVFSKFIQSDSIYAYIDYWEYSCWYKIPVKDQKLLITSKEGSELIDGIQFTKFSLTDNKSATNVSIGTKDGSFYFFTNAKNRVGREIGQKIKAGKKILMYPFSEDYTITVEKFEDIPDFEYVLYLTMEAKRELSGLKMTRMIIFSQYGLYVEFTDGTSIYQNNWY